jgi:hypothetical protein
LFRAPLPAATRPPMRELEPGRAGEYHQPESCGMAAKKDIVQIKNPRSNRYVKIDRAAGKIIAHKTTQGPYKNVPIIKKNSK